MRVEFVVPVQPIIIEGSEIALEMLSAEINRLFGNYNYDLAERDFPYLHELWLNLPGE